MKRIKIKGILLGAIVALGVLVTFVGLLSYLLLSGVIGESGAEIGMIAGISFSTVVSSFVITGILGTNKLPNCLLSAMLVFLVLLVAGLFIDGNFENVITRLVSLVAGSLLSSALIISTAGKKKTAKRQYR